MPEPGMSIDSDLTDILHQGKQETGEPHPSLPGPRPEPSQKLDPKALTVWRLGAAIGTLFFWIPAGVFILISWGTGFLWPWSWAVLTLPVLATVLQVFVIPPIEWRRWRYEITEREVDLQRGVFVVTRTLIPMSRVQHVDTQQGPLLRAYGLAAVTIATAGGVHEIPGLATDVADDVRDRIAALADVADDV
jgi:uncharacterized protein